MKQVTVLCSSDLSEAVNDAFVRAGFEGFVNIPRAVGHKPGAAGEYGRYPHWEAEVFVGPATDEATDRLVASLKEFANRCDVEPCLRILIAPLDAVY